MALTMKTKGDDTNGAQGANVLRQTNVAKLQLPGNKNFVLAHGLEGLRGRQLTALDSVDEPQGLRQDFRIPRTFLPRQAKTTAAQLMRVR